MKFISEMDSAHYIIYLQFYPRDRETSNVLLNIIIMIYIYYFVFRHNNVSSKMNQWPAYFKCFLALDNIILPILYLCIACLYKCVGINHCFIY